MRLKKHGGVKEEACTEDINLAYKLEDGMKIHIPTKQEKEKIKTESEDSITTSSGVVKETESVTETKSEKININTATQTQLESLPGIGSSTALKIIAYRKENGKFKRIEDLKEVSGIGDAKFEKIKEQITL